MKTIIINGLDKAYKTITLENGEIYDTRGKRGRPPRGTITLYVPGNAVTVQEVRPVSKGFKEYHYADGTVVVPGFQQKPKLQGVVKIIEVIPTKKEIERRVEARAVAKGFKEYHYADGSVVVAEFRKRPKLENAVLIIEVVPVQEKKEIPRVTVEADVSAPVNVCVYADGSEVSGKRGRPAPSNNGSALVRIETRIPRADAPAVVATEDDDKYSLVARRVMKKTLVTVAPASLKVGSTVMIPSGQYPDRPEFARTVTYQGTDAEGNILISEGEYHGKARRGIYV